MSKLYNPFTDETIEIGKARYEVSPGKTPQDLQNNSERANRIVTSSALRGMGYGAVGGGVGGASAARSIGRGPGAALGAYVGALGGAVHGEHKGLKRAQEQGVIVRGPKRDRKTGEAVNKRLIPASPASGTNVRSVTPILPGGPHVSHENKLYEHGRRRIQPHGDTAVRSYRGKGSKPAPGGEPIRKRDSAQQGAAVRGSRGTPMSGIAQAGRVGHRLTIS